MKRSRIIGTPYGYPPHTAIFVHVLLCEKTGEALDCLVSALRCLHVYNPDFPEYDIENAARRLARFWQCYGQAAAVGYLARKAGIL